MLGALAIVFVLLSGLIFFTPSLIALLRGTKSKAFVVIMNVVAIPCVTISLFLPTGIWLVLMIVAMLGSKKNIYD